MHKSGFLTLKKIKVTINIIMLKQPEVNYVVIIVGSKFNNEVVERLFTLTGCRHKISSPLPPSN